MSKVSNTGKRAVIYLRVSTQEQAKPNHYGLPLQASDSEHYAVKQGYVILATIRDEGISGTKPVAERPGLAAAMEMCDQGRADVIIVAKQDRLARKSGVFDEILDRALRGRYRLEEAKTGQDLTSRANKIPAHIQAFVASIEAILIADRLYGGRQERSKRDGCGSGQLPWGYIRSVDGTIEIDQQAATIIRQVLALREQYSFRKTAELLNTAGYRTAQGGGWTSASVQRVEIHRALYTTGTRQWDGITAAQKWPQIA